MMASDIQDTIKMPTVSVIIPTYNRAHLLGRAIRSVLAQTLQDWELLVVDDASTDDTEIVARAFGDSRIHYVRHQVNKGAPAARNTGIRKSRSEYIAFLDSDDEFMPEKLEMQLNLFLRDKEGDLGVAVCDFECVKQATNEVVSVSIRPLRGWVYEDLLALRSKSYGTSLIMARKSASCSELHFDESLPSYQDFDFLIRMAARRRCDMVSKPLVRTHLHSGPRIWAGINIVSGKERILEKYASELCSRPRALREHHLSLMRSYWQNGDMSGVRRHIRGAIKAVPWAPTMYLWLLTAACGPRAFDVFLWSRKCSRRLQRLARSTLGILTEMSLR